MERPRPIGHLQKEKFFFSKPRRGFRKFLAFISNPRTGRPVQRAPDVKIFIFLKAELVEVISS